MVDNSNNENQVQGSDDENEADHEDIDDDNVQFKGLKSQVGDHFT